MTFALVDVCAAHPLKRRPPIPCQDLSVLTSRATLLQAPCLVKHVSSISCRRARVSVPELLSHLVNARGERETAPRVATSPTSRSAPCLPVADHRVSR